MAQKTDTHTETQSWLFTKMNQRGNNPITWIKKKESINNFRNQKEVIMIDIKMLQKIISKC